MDRWIAKKNTRTTKFLVGLGAIASLTPYRRIVISTLLALLWVVKKFIEETKLQ